MTGLSILAGLSWHGMSTARAPSQASDISRSSIQNPLESRLFIQGHGSEHGNDVRWGDTAGGSSAVLH